MRWLALTLGAIGVQVATIAGLYYQRVTVATTPTRSDIVVIYVPAIIAATLCAWISYSALRGVIAAVLGTFLAFFISFNLWGT
jgi:hypothetical protein